MTKEEKFSLATKRTLKRQKKYDAIADEIRNNLFKAIVRTHNELFVYNYDMEENPDTRLKFAREVLLSMRDAESATNPKIKKYFHDVVLVKGPKDLISEEQDKKNGIKVAEYAPMTKNIGITPIGLKRTSIGKFVGELAHEYRHAEQRTYRILLPKQILMFSGLGKLFIPYKKRWYEREAKQIEKRIVDNFEERFSEFLASQDRTA